MHLPYFLPDDWSRGVEDEEPEPRDRPYLAAAGRMVGMKGFQKLIPLMRNLPEADLRIAGTGPFEPTLRRLAGDLPNVHFEGLLGGPALARLFRGSRAVVVPSLQLVIVSRVDSRLTSKHMSRRKMEGLVWRVESAAQATGIGPQP